MTNIGFCWYWLIRELNRLIFVTAALIGYFISSLTMLTLFLRILYALFSLDSLFSSKLLTKSKSRLNSFNFPSNRLFRIGSFFVFGSLLALTNSVTYAAAAYVVLFSSVRFRISLFLSTQLTLLTAHFTFAFGIPCNDFNCSFSSLYTNIMSCSNISFSSHYNTVPWFSASLLLLHLCHYYCTILDLNKYAPTQHDTHFYTQHFILHQTQQDLHNHFRQTFQPFSPIDFS